MKCSLLFITLASRSLGPEKFGLVSIGLALFAIIFDALSLGTTQSLVRFVSIALGKNRPQKAREFETVILKLRISEAGFLILIATFLGKYLAGNVYGSSELILPLTLAIASAGGILLVDFFITLFQAHERFVKSGLLFFAVAALKVVLLLWFILNNDISILTVTIAFVATPFIVSLIGFSLSPHSLLKTKVAPSTIRRLIRFSKWMALWGVTASLAGRIDVLLLGKFASAYETGIYSVASRLASGFIIVGSAFSSVLTPKISRVIGSAIEIRRQFLLIWKIVALIVAGMIGAALASTWVIPFIFGHEYSQSVLIFQILTFALIFFMGNIPANVILLSLGHSKWIGFLSFTQLLIVISLSLLLIPSLGAQGAAVSLVVSYITAFVMSTTYAVKKIYS